MSLKNAICYILMTIITVVPMSINCNSIIASADVSVKYQYSYESHSELSISNKIAYCKSSAQGYPGTTTKIIMNQTLQQKKSSGSWGTVQAWSSTVNGSQAQVKKKKDSLSVGTYRLKTVFIVYAGNSSETITKYSSEKTVK